MSKIAPTRTRHVEVKSGELDTLILPYVNIDCMQRFFDEVDARRPVLLSSI